MTYKELIEKKRQEFVEAYLKFTRIDAEIFEVQGFEDPLLVPKYIQAKEDLNNASNGYYDLGLYLMRNKIDLDGEVTLPSE